MKETVGSMDERQMLVITFVEEEEEEDESGTGTCSDSTNNGTNSL